MDSKTTSLEEMIGLSSLGFVNFEGDWSELGRIKSPTSQNPPQFSWGRIN
jgi:hypothetical protein